MKRTGKRFTIDMQDKVKKKKSSILPGLMWKGIKRILKVASKQNFLYQYVLLKWLSHQK